MKLIAKNDDKKKSKFTPITYDEWEKIVKKSKRRRSSSIFSNRTHAACKCALSSRTMTELLIKFYNVIMEKGLFVERWTRILDTIIEKGKGPVLGKLRITQLIEADL